LADKSTRLILDALKRAVSESAGVPLFISKGQPGLFPQTAAARLAAQKCKDEGWLEEVSDAAKPPRELVRITARGREYLVQQSNPRELIDDFVRVLEARHDQASQLLASAANICQMLTGLRQAVEALRQLHQPATVAAPAPAPAPTPTPASTPASAANGVAAIGHAPQAMPLPRTDPDTTGPCPNPKPNPDPVAQLADELAEELARRQDDDARGDCPLSQLYRWAQTRNADLSIGTFHDALRLLHERQRIYLHPWTGPLYDLPEPHFALLVGHEVAYYASSRRTATVLMERVGC
jgi:hypothetical protein